MSTSHIVFRSRYKSSRRTINSRVSGLSSMLEKSVNSEIPTVIAIIWIHRHRRHVRAPFADLQTKIAQRRPVNRRFSVISCTLEFQRPAVIRASLTHAVRSFSFFLSRARNKKKFPETSTPNRILSPSPPPPSPRSSPSPHLGYLRADESRH